ncbi:hypothetical protein ACEWA7_20015 [Vibrio parahaemolyticus]
MSVRHAQKAKRRQDRKNKKIKDKPSPAPDRSLMDGVKPLLVDYINSEQKYLDIFKSLERGQVYLVATEGPETIHVVLSEKEYLEMMPVRDRGALSERFSRLADEKVVAYTEDDTGFMTYFFEGSEVIRD